MYLIFNNLEVFRELACNLQKRNEKALNLGNYAYFYQ